MKKVTVKKGSSSPALNTKKEVRKANVLRYQRLTNHMKHKAFEFAKKHGGDFQTCLLSNFVLEGSKIVKMQKANKSIPVSQDNSEVEIESTVEQLEKVVEKANGDIKNAKKLLTKLSKEKVKVN